MPGMPLDTIGLGRIVAEARRGDRQDGDALLVDEEGVFVGAVRRAAILDDAQPARGDLVDDPVVEQDDAVGHVFLEPVPCELPLAALGRDHGRDAALLEPAEQAAQLGAQDRRVVEAGEQRLDRVEHDPLRPDLLDGVVEPDEQALEIVIAGFLDLAALDAHIVDDELLVGDQARHVVAERGDVGGEIVGGLLEAHEDARLAVERHAVDQEGHGEQGLAAAGGAADERRPPGRQAAEHDLVEAVDAGRRLVELRLRLGLRRRPVHDPLRLPPSLQKCPRPRPSPPSRCPLFFV